MSAHKSIIDFSIKRPKTVMAAVAIFMIAAAMFIPRLHIDTDPENMLPPDQAARVFHHLTKQKFTLYDALVVGVVNEKDPDGVFNPTSLAHIHDLTNAIAGIDGVIRKDLMSLSNVDNITSEGPGVVRFAWMMEKPPATREEAIAIRDAAKRIPTIDGTLVSEDGRAAAILVPIESKNQSHRIASRIESIVDGYGGDERYFITGLPVAEDTFGVEMFRQMGIAAPAAGLIIFLLMWIFFRSVALITAPMLLAVATVTITMGLLIAMGFPVHIMSSMIPIFLMPIAVVDSVHILSEFADQYPRIKDRRRTIEYVMEDLFSPMLYTSLTSAAGFASLMMAPIPPVRVFGGFVAFGIALAFLLTVTFIPAYIASLSDARIEKLRRHDPSQDRFQFLGRILGGLGPRTLANSKPIIAVTLVVVAVSVWGITRIQINDNPVRWFRPDHRIRVADRVLNHHFGGTYNAFLVLDQTKDATDTAALDRTVRGILKGGAGSAVGADPTARWGAILHAVNAGPAEIRLSHLLDGVYDAMDAAETDAEAARWQQVADLLEKEQTRAKFFQRPEALEWIAGLQKDMVQECTLVGKSTSLADIVKTVHRDLRQGDPDYYSIPGSAPGVAQTLLSYQSSHRPDDLWHFVTPDYRSANVWVQLKSGDNQDMARVERFVSGYIHDNPPPEGVTLDWAGLTYLNVVWQDKMVSGMLNALLGSFVIVFIMMVVLFRKLWFALLAMLPLSVTIAFIYGLIGLVGKDYDMPVAVLSSLTLGLSVDFAIHFLQRSRSLFAEHRDWNTVIEMMFEEPARAISRNAIVIAVGFLPLLASPLVPYNTVGFFLAAIMAVSAVVTLVLLPAVMKHMKTRLFGKDAGAGTPAAETELRGAAMKSAAVLLALGLGLAAAAPAARAQDLTDVNTIIDRANNAAYYAGDDGRAEVRMTITDAQGRERMRQFVILRKDVADGGDQHYAVLFSRPADVRGTVFLVDKHTGSDDDRWLYLPALDLVKRIAAGDKRTSFVGSHFFYEDVSGRGIDEDTHALVETNDKYYVVKSVPKDPGSVEFASWTAWIDKTTFVPMKMEYVDAEGKVYRRIEALAVATFQGHPTVTKMQATDVRDGGHTLSEFRGIQYDIGIPDDVFTERTLRTPSRQWFRVAR